MSEFTIVAKSSLEIDFGATGEQEILQNVAMILDTVMQSCPMDRDFAWDGSALDKPITVAKSLLSSRLIAAINAYEDRVEITNISFTGSEGVLQPIVRVRING